MFFSAICGHGTATRHLLLQPSHKMTNGSDPNTFRNPEALHYHQPFPRRAAVLPGRSDKGKSVINDKKALFVLHAHAHTCTHVSKFFSQRQVGTQLRISYISK